MSAKHGVNGYHFYNLWLGMEPTTSESQRELSMQWM